MTLENSIYAFLALLVVIVLYSVGVTVLATAWSAGTKTKNRGTLVEDFNDPFDDLMCSQESFADPTVQEWTDRLLDKWQKSRENRPKA